MAHLLEQNDWMVSGMNSTPWHGIGTVVEGLMTASEVIHHARLGWTVEQEPLFLKDGIELPATNAVANVRQDTREVLGITTNNYQILQNVDAFSAFDGIVQEKLAIYETAGSLKNGRIVWILAKLPDTIELSNKDNINKYLMLRNSHDGLSTLVVGFTCVRVVCNNTLTAALNGMTNRVCIAHRKSMMQRIADAREALGMANKWFSQFEALCNTLKDVPATSEKVSKFLKVMYPMDIPDGILGDTKAIDKYIGNVEERRSAVRTLAERDAIKVGTDMMMWNLYNGATELVDHYGRSRNEENRMSSVMWGAGADIKIKAFDEAYAIAME